MNTIIDIIMKEARVDKWSDKDKIEEDKDTITQAIQLYFDNKGKIAKNIYTSNYSDLKSWIQEYLPKGEESKHQEFLSKPVAEGNGYKIYKITTVGQCVKIGKGTSWCIQGKKWATSYLKNGPLWLITKNDKRFALLQPVSGSYMDVNDNSLSPEVMFEIIDAWPDLKGLLLENSDKFPLQYFKYTKDVPEEEQLIVIKKNPDNISYIENPSKKVIDIIISKLKENPRWLAHVKDHVSDDLILELIELKPSVVTFFKKPKDIYIEKAIKHIDKKDVNWDNKIKFTEQQQLEIVKKSPDAVLQFDNPSEKVQLEALKLDPMTLRYIKSPTEKVQLLAVVNNGKAIKHIKKPTVKVQMAAVKNSWLALGYIDDPNKSVIDEAIKINPKAADLV